MSPTAPPDSAPKPIDLQEVTRLLAALEADLAHVKAGSASVDALRTEVEALRAALGEPQATVAPERLHHVHGLLGDVADTVEVDAIRAAQYVTQIGRLIGLS